MPHPAPSSPSPAATLAGALTLFSLLLASWSTAHADGYLEGTKGARAAGRAGAFTARADDLSAVQINPAGLSHLSGTLLHGGNRISHNAHRFTRAPTLDPDEDPNDPPLVSFAQVDNDAPWQALDPFIGVSTDFGLDAFQFALSVYAPAGIGKEEYPIDGGQRYMMVRRDAQIINYALSAAWRHEDVIGVGASFLWIAVPKLDYQLVVDGEFSNDAHPVASVYDMLTTIEGSDLFTPNLVLGAWYRPVPSIEIGVAAQVIPATIETDSTLSIEPLSGDMGVALSRPGQPGANDVSLLLPLPITARAGVRYRHLEGGRELFDVELDFVFEGWSRVDQFTLDTRGISAMYEGVTEPIDNIAVPKRWRDTFNLLLGGDYAAIVDLLTLRAGVFYESAVSDPAYANVDFVNGAQLGGSLGASLLFGDLEVALAYVYRHSPEVTVSEDEARVYKQVPLTGCDPPYTDTTFCDADYLGQPSPAANAGTYSADSSVIALDVLYRF